MRLLRFVRWDQLAIISVVDGIVLTEKDFFDFNEKYSSDQHLESYCPAPLPEGVSEKIQGWSEHFIKYCMSVSLLVLTFLQ